MGCFGTSKKYQVKEGTKWHYVNLNDFRSRNCIAIFSYVWVWCLAIISVVVYTLDTFTAVKLLGFNQWSSKIEPVIDFNVNKWIFSGTIMFSWVLLMYEYFRAWRVMKKESITEDYLDPLAVVLQCLRIPSGWRRFLIFAELTKSKKKAAWVAIFVYFQRKDAIRLLAAEGPRVVLNGFTFYSVARSKIVEGPHDAGDSLVTSFFKNVKNLYNEEPMQAVVLASMAFTAIIWLIFMILLILALILWLFFLSHYVKRETLTGYCRRKVEARLAKIVKEKTEKIWEEEQKKTLKDGGKGGKKKIDFDDIEAIKRQPTLPVFGFNDSPPKGGFLDRNESVSTLPRYTSQPTTPAGEDTLPRMPLSRNESEASYASNAGLLDNAGGMGYSGPHQRPGTASSHRSYASRDGSISIPPLSTPANDPRMPPSARSSPMSTAERRYSPQNSNPWRTPVSAVDENSQGYEMHQPAVPSALRPQFGPRRDMSSPGPNRGGPMPGGPQRSFTDSPSAFPRSMTPGGPQPNRSMTPTSGVPPSLRSMTPTSGVPQSLRSMTPTSGIPPSLRSMTPAGQPSSLTPGPPRMNTPQTRNQTPDMSQPPWSSGNSRPGQGGGPGSMAF